MARAAAMHRMLARPLPALFVCLVAFLGCGLPRCAAAGESALDDAVTRHLGLYLALPDRREASEGVRLEGDQLEMWFLEPLGTGRDARLCAGFRWLLAGRMERSTGIKGLLGALSQVNGASLVFYDLETSVTPDAQGRYTQAREVHPTARFTISRAKALRLVPAKQLRGVLEGPSCVRRGEQLVDSFWTEGRGAAPAAPKSKGARGKRAAPAR